MTVYHLTGFSNIVTVICYVICNLCTMIHFHNYIILKYYIIYILYRHCLAPNIPLKIPQTSINKGRKTSWRLGALLTGGHPL
jgi:hypothetical protein